ncbi:MAG: hypothetical protein ABJX32_04735 [Tateyamaria sp.]|uniref:hypothetical protein n=1 Tax=Tateyamaria sp. TaxID=1929288 RepID=UPI00329B7002
MTNKQFTIIFPDPDHSVYEASIRNFCAEHAHPSAMTFLHLPVSDDLTLDCEWDDPRDVMIVTELAKENSHSFRIAELNLPQDHPMQRLLRPN